MTDASVPGGANRWKTTPYGARALAAEAARLAQATEGERNTTLNAVWIKLCQRINAGHLSYEHAWQHIYNTARQIGLEDREIRATMASAEGGAASHPWPVPPPRQPSPGHLGFAQPGGLPADTATSTDLDRQPAAPLPDAFWNEREALGHIRQAAHSRGRSAEAVLGAVLARIAADTPHTVKLPPLVGARCGLTLITALTGPPGTGKSSAKAVAVELLPAHILDDECDDVPPGSGEGMLEILFTFEEDPETGKAKKRQTRHNAFVYADEGEVLAMQARRNASNTILPTLRSAFTDATLGQANASIERRRRVPGGSYVYGIVLGLQPGKSADLLGDAGGGTPQRFLWMPTDAWTPPPGNRPEWPGELKRPGLGEPEFTGAYGITDMQVADAIAAEVATRDHHRQQHGADELDEHVDLIRLKVAAVLAILDGRRNINGTDWELAEGIMLVSAGTRRRVQGQIAENRDEDTRRKGKRKAVETEIVEDSIDERAMASAKRSAAKRVTVHHATHPQGSCGRSCITRAMPGRARGRVSVDDVISRAITEGLIKEVEDDRYQPGRHAPS